MVILSYNWTAYPVDGRGQKMEEWDSYEEAKERYDRLCADNVEFIFEVHGGYAYVPALEDGKPIFRIVALETGKIV